jgi:hypothetical protein
MLRPPISVRVFFVILLSPVAAFFALVGFESILVGGWPAGLLVMGLACFVILLVIHTWIRAMSIQDGMLTIHGLRRRQIPVGSISRIGMTPSRTYPGLQLVSIIGTDGKPLYQLAPIWDRRAVASWAERIPIPFGPAGPG